jgi:hypothetical protein
MKTIEKGLASKELLENPLLQESLESIRAAIIAQWTVTTDPKLREELWFTLMGSTRFEGLLKIAIENGRVDLSLKEKYGE